VTRRVYAGKPGAAALAPQTMTGLRDILDPVYRDSAELFSRNKTSA